MAFTNVFSLMKAPTRLQGLSLWRIYWGTQSWATVRIFLKANCPSEKIFTDKHPQSANCSPNIVRTHALTPLVSPPCKCSPCVSCCGSRNLTITGCWRNWVKSWPPVPGRSRCQHNPGFYQNIVNISIKSDCFPQQSPDSGWNSPRPNECLVRWADMWAMFGMERTTNNTRQQYTVRQLTELPDLRWRQ